MDASSCFRKAVHLQPNGEKIVRYFSKDEIKAYLYPLTIANLSTDVEETATLQNADSCATLSSTSCDSYQNFNPIKKATEFDCASASSSLPHESEVKLSEPRETTNAFDYKFQQLLRMSCEKPNKVHTDQADYNNIFNCTTRESASSALQRETLEKLRLYQTHKQHKQRSCLHDSQCRFLAYPIYRLSAPERLTIYFRRLKAIFAELKVLQQLYEAIQN